MVEKKRIKSNIFIIIIFLLNEDKKRSIRPKKPQQNMWKCYEKDLSARISPALSLAHLFNIYYLTVIFNYLCEVE